MGSMDERYFDNFQALFKIMTAYLISPDLLIYLRASVPVHRMESLSRIECRLFGLFPE
jgi:deoxyadenosine/deoxycytidine kinase